MTICVFGDSVTKGVVYDEIKNKYMYLKNCFVNLFSQNSNLPIVNYSRFGCTVTKGIAILNRHREELSSFSHTILEFGGNDCDFNWGEISRSPRENHIPNVPLPLFEEIYRKMIDIIRSAGSAPIALSLPPLEPERFFRWISKGFDPENILKYLGEVNTIYKWQESYNDAIRKIANSCSIGFVDIRGAFLKENSYSDFLCLDGMHPNEKGHALISKELSAITA